MSLRPAARVSVPPICSVRLLRDVRAELGKEKLDVLAVDPAALLKKSAFVAGRAREGGRPTRVRERAASRSRREELGAQLSSSPLLQ